MHKRILIIGGSGFVGQEIALRLIKSGAIVSIASRFPESSAYLKTAGNVGQVNLIPININNESSLEFAIKGHDTVINLVGLLHESSQKFRDVHTFAAANVAKISFKNGIRNLIHFSALGVNQATNSKYAKSKFAGEEQVLKFFPNAIIIRPSIIFGKKDNFFNKFANLAKYSPFLVVVDKGSTLFQPVYVKDIALAVETLIDNIKYYGKIFELAGPKVYSFKELMQYIISSLKIKRKILSLPKNIAQIMAFFFEFLPNPPLTLDQIQLLSVNNVIDNENARFTFRNLNIHPKKIESIVFKNI